MNNIKKLIEEIQEEFDDKFVEEGADIWHVFFNEEEPVQVPPNKVKSFIKESNLRVVEKAKEIVENVKITGTRRFDGDDIEEKAKLTQEIYDKMIKPVLLSALTEQK